MLIANFDVQDGGLGEALHEKYELPGKLSTISAPFVNDHRILLLGRPSALRCRVIMLFDLTMLVSALKVSTEVGKSQERKAK